MKVISVSDTTVKGTGADATSTNNAPENPVPVMVTVGLPTDGPWSGDRLVMTAVVTGTYVMDPGAESPFGLWTTTSTCPGV